MDLKIHNVAKIEYADLKLDGITVIAGENNTGKSTVGKIVFALFNSLYHIRKKTAGDRRRKLASIFSNELEESTFDIDFPFFDVDTAYFDNHDYHALLNCDYSNKDLVFSQICALFEGYYEAEENINQAVVQNQTERVIDKIMEVLQITDEQICKIKVSEYYKQVFDAQINNITKAGENGAAVEAVIRGKKIDLHFADNLCSHVNMDIQIQNQAVYIDNPFVLDKMDMFDANENIMAHDLIRKLRNNKSKNLDSNSYDDAIIQNRLEDINHLLASAVHGNFAKEGASQSGFLEEGSEVPAKIQNVSAGLKSFLIIKRLIENKQLRQKDVVVLDEPEIHLHPQWQLLYAKLIAELQRAFDLNIIITTHSPYFLAAIEKYTPRRSDVNYYLSSVKHNAASFEHVNGCLYKVYELLSQPFDDL